MSTTTNTALAVRHPARFSDVILPILQTMVPADKYAYVLDPFAGTGRIHELTNSYTIGIELEPEWAAMHPRTFVGDATDLDRIADGSVDAVVTSPAYGNRMADHHNARDASKRNTYRHALGRDLSPNSSATLQWGDGYRALHERAWREARRVLRPGGRFVVNIKDHIRKGKQQHVSYWHLRTIKRLGFVPVQYVRVYTPGQRYGQNGAARLPYEWVLAFDKPAAGVPSEDT